MASWKKFSLEWELDKLLVLACMSPPPSSQHWEKQPVIFSPLGIIGGKKIGQGIEPSLYIADKCLLQTRFLWNLTRTEWCALYFPKSDEGQLDSFPRHWKIYSTRQNWCPLIDQDDVFVLKSLCNKIWLQLNYLWQIFLTPWEIIIFSLNFTLYFFCFKYFCCRSSGK